MGLKRKYAKITKSRRSRSRRWARRRIVRNIGGIHSFKRSFRLSQIAMTAGTTLMYGEQFDITQLPNFTEFSALFDQYRVDKIKFEIVPCQTGADTNPNTTSIFLPNIWSCIDKTDSTPPTGINEIMQYPGAKRTKITTRHSRSFKPHVMVDVNNVVINSKGCPWLAFGAPIPLYGVKWGLDQIFNVASGGFGIDRYVTFYFSCKAVK